MTPNPRVVSRELLTRDSFVPATSLNMLAAAWIQFMTRDWFSHGTEPHRTTRGSSRCRPATTCPRTRCSSRAPWPTRPAPPPTTGAPPHAHQPRDALVGRVADLRHRPGSSRPGAHRQRRQDCAWSTGRPACHSAAELLDQLRPGAGLVGRPGALLSPVRPRAQRHLRPPRNRSTRAGQTTTLFQQGAPHQRRPAGQDPHRRVDTGHHRPSGDDRSRMRTNWWGIGGEALHPIVGRVCQTTRSSAASRVQPTTTIRRPTRSPKSSSPSTACTR